MDGTLIGFRSFSYTGKHKLSLQTRGEGVGEFIISTELGGAAIGKIAVTSTRCWQTDCAEIPFSAGDGDLYLTYHGKGSKELIAISFDGGNDHA